MAHGRQGPDIVMTIQPAAASDIQAMTQHELYRTPDGSSAIDPLRSHLNEILLGPRSQQAAVKKLYDDGVAKPARQAEAPFVQMVLSASSDFFRKNDQGSGEWDKAILKRWVKSTMDWLKKEYGEDLIHVALHLDEDVPHLHVLIAPTYPRMPRMPGKQCKDETAEEFTTRKEKALNAEPVRTVGRASNLYWKRNYVKRIARQSYHAAMEILGLGYGRDFVAEGAPSPRRKDTGTWVREQAALLKEAHAKLASDGAALDAERAALDNEWALIETSKETTESDKARVAAQQAKTEEALRSQAEKLEGDRASFEKEKTRQMHIFAADRAQLEAYGASLSEKKKEFSAYVSGLKNVAKNLSQREKTVEEKEAQLDRLLDTARGIFSKLLPTVSSLAQAVGLHLPHFETVGELANAVKGLEEEAHAMRRSMSSVQENEKVIFPSDT